MPKVTPYLSIAHQAINLVTMIARIFPRLTAHAVGQNDCFLSVAFARANRNFVMVNPTMKAWVAKVRSVTGMRHTHALLDVFHGFTPIRIGSSGFGFQ
jgi:hypothetical protein